MRFMVRVPASPESEAGEMPGTELLEVRASPSRLSHPRSGGH